MIREAPSRFAISPELSVEPDLQGRVDYDWLDGQDAVWESRHVRHVRLDEPLDVRIDCANRLGLIRRGEG